MLFMILKSFGLGALIGVIFKLFKLPVPAPDSWVGVAGVVGVTAGFYLFKYVARFFA